MIKMKYSIALAMAICLNSAVALRSLVSSMKGLSSLGVATSLSSQSSSSIGWDSHKAVDSIPDSLVRTIDGNAGMRKKFEQVCREAQVKLQYITDQSSIQHFPDTFSLLGKYLQSYRGN